MNFCHECGVKLENEPNYCPACGKALKQQTAQMHQTSTFGEEGDSTVKTNNSPHWKGLGLFLLSWIVGGLVLSFIIALLGLGGATESIGPVVCFILGIYLWWTYVSDYRAKEKKMIDS